MSARCELCGDTGEIPILRNDGINEYAPCPHSTNPLKASQAAREAADAVAEAIVRYAVAYTHDTLADMSTANRSWKVHETGHGDPFERNVWLGEFDNKADANALARDLRQAAAHEAVARFEAQIRQECAGALETRAKALEPFAAMGRVMEARALITFGRAVPDGEVVCKSAGEVGLGILTMGHFRDAAALLPDAPGWGGIYRSTIRTAIRENPNAS